MDLYLSNFSLKFQEKVKRFRRWQDAQLSLLGRVLLMKGLAHLNYKFDESKLKYNPFDKPYFDDNHVHFNISHSEDFAVCGVTQLGEIGIDIEKINPISISSFKSQMTPAEWEMVNNIKNSKRAFYTYWSQKEAVIKAHGRGLNIPLKSFEIENNITAIGDENFYLREVNICDNYSCHIAIKKRLEAVNIQISKIEL